MPFKEFDNRLRPNFSDILLSVSIEAGDAGYDNPKVGINTRLPGVRWQPGIQLFDFETVTFDNIEYKGWLSYIAQEYKAQLKEAIETQEFKQQWEPLTKKYKDWKKKAGLSTDIWIRSGQLYEAIKVKYFPATDSYGVGIDANERFKEIETIKDSNGEITGHRVRQRGDTSVLFIARLMEYGTENMPPRALFRPVKKRIAKNISKYFYDYVRQEDLALVG